MFSTQKACGGLEEDQAWHISVYQARERWHASLGSHKAHTWLQKNYYLSNENGT